jgi:secreted PhoX family phosphatase
MGLAGKANHGWARFHDRFDLQKTPNEPNRFGWVVEIDPYDPNSTPVKRTSLGRYKHEAATTALTPDGRVVVYSGDDQRFEYLYRFVSRDRFNPDDRAANKDLLDHGTNSVARFNDDGGVEWLPLVFGEGPLTPANGFRNQADIVIDIRRAADLVKATPMDRPEDVEPSPTTGKVYVVLTNNTSRKAAQVDKANPRADNKYGQILELTPPDRDGKPDHAAATFQWDMFIMAGNPADPAHGARYGEGISPSGWLACPDNIAFDARGRLWIATDQGEQQSVNGIGDGIWACDTSGPGRAVTRMFFRTPTGAEMCGPAFTPDDRSLFVAVQHPANDDPTTTYATPSTRWPDFQEGMPPRPSVVSIVKRDGGVIGG